MRYRESQVKSLYNHASAFQQLSVGEVNGVRFMRFGGSEAGWQGAMVLDQPELLYFPYQQAFSFYTAWQPHVGRFLSLGVGTGTAISHVYRRHPQAEIVGVEWDQEVLVLAEVFFQMPIAARVQLFEADARTFVTDADGQFDLIYLDVYFQEETPRILHSSLYLHALSELLAPGGVLAINAILATKGPRSQVFFRLCADLEALVGPTYHLTLGALPFVTHNVMIFAQRMPEPEQSLTQIRRKCWREIGAYAQNYPWEARVLPLQIRKSGKKV